MLCKCPSCRILFLVTEIPSPALVDMDLLNAVVVREELDGRTSQTCQVSTLTRVLDLWLSEWSSSPPYGSRILWG